MADATAPDQTPLARQLLADAYWHLVQMLRLTLPPPADDSAAARRKRDHAAIAQIAALAPGNAVEAELAAQFVTAAAQWQDCLRLTRETDDTWELIGTRRGGRNRLSEPLAARNSARALAMMREARSTLRDLQRMQEARRQLDADPAARDRAAQHEYAAACLMLQALSEDSATADGFAETASAEPEPPAAEPEPKLEAPPAPVAELDPAPHAATTPAEPDLILAAERYAAAYPERAALIRRTGKLPTGGAVYFNPPELALAPVLVAGPTAALRALDHTFPEHGAT
jgi:hypothetical protein